MDTASDTDPLTRKAPLPPSLSSSVEADARTELWDAEGARAEADARPLVGRTKPLSALRACIERAFLEGRTTLLAIEGEAGSGKSLLLQRGSEMAAKKHMDVRVVYAACRTRDDGPYAPFSRLLLDRFGITPSSSPTRVRQQMATAVAQAMQERQGSDTEEVTHLLGHVAGVPFPDSHVLRDLADDPWALHRKATAALTDFLKGDAQDRPTLLLLDDMAEAENHAWEVVEELLEVRAPIAMVVAGRPPVAELTSELGADSSSHVAAVHLTPLDETQTASLVDSLIPGLGSLPAPFLTALRFRCRGNPASLTQMIQTLSEAQLFVNRGRGLEVDMEALESGELPLSMSDAMRARLDALEPEALIVMQRAAIVGECFWDGALLALGRADCDAKADDPLDVWSDNRDEMDMVQILSDLEAKGLVVPTGNSQTPGLSEYTFSAPDGRSVIYGDLPDEMRVRGHATVARWLVMTKDLQVEGMPALIAPHLEHAGLLGRAGRAYLDAADQERTLMRTGMALRYVDKALDLITAEDITHRLAALHQRGSLLTVLGRYDEAHEAFAEILTLSWKLGARDKGGAAHNRIARIHRQRGEHDKALDHLRRALLLFRAADDQRGVASTFDDMAQVHRLLGNPEHALVAAKEALEIRGRTQDKRGQAVSLNTIGYIELDRGSFDTAELRFTSAMRIRESEGDHEGAIQTRIALGRLAFHRRRLDEAIEIYVKALEGAREMDNHRFQSYLLNHLGEAYLAADRLPEARQALEEAKTLATDMRDQRALADVERNLGLVALEAGDDGAGETLHKALELALGYGTHEAIAMAHRGIGRLKARTLFDGTGRTDTNAEKSFRECIRVFTECGNRHEVARTQAELGYHLIERGDPRGARLVLQTAHNAMLKLSLPDRERLHKTLGELQ